jgi:DNA-binding FadR family transcriptional regulator
MLNISEKIEKHIITSIHELKAGEKLSSELEFARELGVSRASVRESISRLRMLGILESRRKRGLVVGEPELFRGMQSILETNLLNESTRRELFELRMMFEIGMADSVCRNFDEKSISELTCIVDEYDKAESDVERVNHDYMFHAKLYEISGNSLLAKFQETLLPFFSDAYIRGIRDNSNTFGHRDLLEVLKNRVPTSFREAMREHLAPHFNAMKYSKKQGNYEDD